MEQRGVKNSKIDHLSFYCESFNCFIEFQSITKGLLQNNCYIQDMIFIPQESSVYKLHFVTVLFPYFDGRVMLVY